MLSALASRRPEATASAASRSRPDSSRNSRISGTVAKSVVTRGSSKTRDKVIFITGLTGPGSRGFRGLGLLHALVADGAELERFLCSCLPNEPGECG